jgi:fibronectin-binding autotransporter adhesin
MSAGTSGVLAVDKYWGNVETDFNTPSYWMGGAPGSNDRGIFSVPLRQPVVTSPVTVSGLTFFSPAFIVSDTGGPLTLNSNVTNSDLASALFAAAPGVTTVTSSLELGAPGEPGTPIAGFSAVLGSELVVSGNISGVRSLQKMNFGTVTLSGNNTFTGGVNGNGGNGIFGLTRLNINSNTALGTGAFTINQGNSGSTVGNTSGTAKTLANAVILNVGSGLASNWDLPANGTGDLTFNGGATLNGAAGNSCNIHVVNGTLTLNGGLTESAGTLGFIKSGAGTLVLGGTIAHTGVFTLSGGTLVVDMGAGGSGITNTALALAPNNTTFTLKGASTGTSAQTLNGASAFSNRTGITVDGNGGTSTTLTLSNATWTRNTSSTLAVQLNGNATLVATPATSAGGMVIGSGNAAFATVKDATGVGFATASAGNVVRYTGATVLTAGGSGNTTNFITRVGDPEYVGNTLILSAGNRTINTLQLDTTGGAGVLDLNGTSVTFTDRGLLMTGNNDFAIQSGVLGSATELVIHQFSTGVLTIQSQIGGVTSNNGSVTKTGPGTLVLAASNQYNTTVVNEGLLAITGSVRGAVTVTGSTAATSGTLSLQNAGAVTAGNLTISGAGKLVQTVPNAISGSAAVNVNGFLGSAVANLSHANDYTGTTTIGTGTLNVGHPAAIGSGTLSIGGGRLDNTSGAAMTMANNNPITFTSSLLFVGTHSLNFGTGAVNLGTTAKTVVISANTLTLGGDASGVGGGISKAGPGTLALGGNNSFTGTTTVSGGVLLLNGTNALPGGTGAAGGLSNLTLSGGVVGLGAGDFFRPIGTTAADVQITSAGGGFAAYGGNRIVNLGGAGIQLNWATTGFLTNPNAASATFMLGASAATHTVDFQNPINLLNTGTGSVTRTIFVEDGVAPVDAKISGALSNSNGTASLTKVGTGTLELSGINTYNGLTSVAAGTLLVNGEIQSTSGVNVAGGATLGGNGIITTPTGGGINLFSGSALAPGNIGPGTLTVNVGVIGMLDLSGAANQAAAFQFQLGTSSDLVVVTNGTLNIGNGVLEFDDFLFSNSGGFGAGSYTLFDTQTLIAGSPGVDLTGNIGGFTATIGLSDDQTDLVLTVVPEPGSVALLLGGLGMLMARRRRR